MHSFVKWSCGFTEVNLDEFFPVSVFLDSNADCNGPVRELYGQSARVIGQGADQSRPGPQSCTLKLKSTSTYEQTNIAIEVVRVTINQDNVRFTMYDGDEGSSVLVRVLVKLFAS